MEEKKITLSSGKEYVVKEVLYKDVVSKTTDVSKEEAAKVLLQLSCGLTDDEYNTLSMKDGIALQKVVNEINGFDESFLSTAPQEIDTSAN